MHATISAKKQEARLTALQAEIEALQKELREGEDAEQIVKKHISLLHRYNEAKDATQVSGYLHTTTDIETFLLKDLDWEGAYDYGYLHSTLMFSGARNHKTDNGQADPRGSGPEGYRLER